MLCWKEDECRFIYRWLYTWVRISYSICECNSRHVFRMVDVFSCSAKLHFNIPKFNWWLKYYIFDVAWSCFSSSLIFDMKIMSIMLIMNNLISRPPFQVPLPWLLVLEVNSVVCLKWWWFSVVFCAFLKQFSSRVSLAIARTRQCASKFSNLDSGSPRYHCMGSRSSIHQEE